MITILKNEFERIKYKKSILVIALIIMPLLIVAAIFFSGQSTTKETIAFFSQDSVINLHSEQYEIETIKEPLTLSQLVRSEYAAFVTKSDDGGYTVMSLKNEDDKAAIQTLFQTGHLPTGQKSDDQKRQERGVGTNILGFITMMMLIQAVALTTLYPEDRENKTFRRIMTSPASIRSYLSAQLIFTMICLYIPTFVATCIIHFIFGVNIGFSLEMFALLLFILTLLATAFALFISTVFNRNTNLAASGISIITCILAGCFIPITTSNLLLSWICKIIPQTEFMNLVHGIAIGDRLQQYVGNILYILLWTALLLLAGMIIAKKKNEKGLC